MTAITTRQDKIRKTIAKWEKRLADLNSGKLDAKLQKKSENWEFVKLCDIRWAEDCIKSGKKKLAEAIRLDAKETAKIEKENAKNDFIASLPQCLRDWMETHRLAVIDYEMKKMAEWNATFAKMSDDEFREMRRNTPARYREMLSYVYGDITEESIRKNAALSAKTYIIDLIARVQKYVGTITSLAQVTTDGLAINGYITGEKGKVELRTIIAGGYNIQCLHNRVIVIKC